MYIIVPRKCDFRVLRGDSKRQSERSINIPKRNSDEKFSESHEQRSTYRTRQRRSVLFMYTNSSIFLKFGECKIDETHPRDGCTNFYDRCHVYIFEKYCVDVTSAFRFLSFSINLRYSILILRSCVFLTLFLRPPRLYSLMKFEIFVGILYYFYIV